METVHEWVDLRQRRFRLLPGGTGRRRDGGEIINKEDSDDDSTISNTSHQDNDKDENESEHGIGSMVEASLSYTVGGTSAAVLTITPTAMFARRPHSACFPSPKSTTKK
jgi:hypothetical protein